MISHEELVTVVVYDPQSGMCRWKETGLETAPSLSDGYRRIMIKGTRYKAHRLAWFYVTGIWPPQEIDHIDGNRSNNSFSNLRLADKRQNQWNRAANKGYEGRKGVYFNSIQGKWKAQINIGGKRVSLGGFSEKMDAIHRYVTVAKSMHGDYFRNTMLNEQGF